MRWVHRLNHLFTGGAAALSVLISPMSLWGSPLLLSRLAGAAALSSGEKVIEERGGTVRHRFPPAHIIVDLDPCEERALAEALGEGWSIVSQEVSSPSSPAHHAWNRLLQPRPDRGSEKVHAGKALVGDCFLPPAGAAKAAGGSAYGPYGAGFWDGSEYLLGRVGVAVILPESDGTVDPSTEDWAAEEKAHIASHVVEAMDWWASQTQLGPLSFSYEYHYDVPVPYEPISHPQSDEALWIEAALGSLGYTSGDRFTRTQNLVNDLKERLNTDWGLVIYVVDSSNDPDGTFASSHFAYAYLGGPFAVLTLDNDGWGQANFSAVCAHETGHIFYALDEYYGAGSPCGDESGYLRYSNQNSQYGTCFENVPSCIMRSVPLSYATLCSFTPGQAGWADTDGDSLPDLLETDPVVEVSSVGKNSSSLVEGVSTVSPVANQNPLGYGNDISINTISLVEYRLDGGAWTAAAPTDGAWGDGSESFSFEPVAEETGLHHLEVRAVNSMGIVSAAYFDAMIEIHSATGVSLPSLTALPGVVHALGNRPNPFNPQTDIHLLVTSDVEVHAAVYDPRGSLVKVLFRGRLPAGPAVLHWSGRGENGGEVSSGRYIYLVRAGGSVATGAMLLLR